MGARCRTLGLWRSCVPCLPIFCVAINNNPFLLKTVYVFPLLDKSVILITDMELSVFTFCVKRVHQFFLTIFSGHPNHTYIPTIHTYHTFSHQLKRLLLQQNSGSKYWMKCLSIYCLAERRIYRYRYRFLKLRSIL